MNTFKARLLDLLEDYPGPRSRLAQDLDVSVGTTWNWTKEKPVEPRFSQILALGLAFNINMNWLFYGVGPKYRPTVFLDEGTSLEPSSSEAKKE